ncbi:unnamed protein product [Euphydryas editha]|uniref:Reverse transcriptase domain-containing protein n=1 Tax=Euphydryas editha TaxID=104508 RepID=A0AAU9UA54_EUPED|nr:unnamed protein product [Euphydryas editha]
MRLPKSKAPLPDEIPSMAIRVMPWKCLVVLTRLFNSILRTGHFKEAWTLGKFIVLPKPSKDRHRPSSYHPITLLSHVAKLFERLLLRKIVPHLPLRVKQFGFCSEHSTTLQLTRVLNLLACEINRGRCTVGIFLDIEKAFDRVSHEGLVAKLLKTSLPQAIVRLLASFLANRQFFVAVENAESGIRSIKAGVPQGSCLSPRLYAAYTDEIPKLNESLQEWKEDIELALYVISTGTPQHLPSRTTVLAYTSMA